MMLGEIYRFELGYQLRRKSTWVLAATFLALAGAVIAGFIANARSGDFHFNSPLMISATGIVSAMVALIVIAPLAGDAAGRDAGARIEPLLFTTPLGRTAFLAGRFLAAFTLVALLLALVPAMHLAATRLPGVEAALLGPFRPDAYLAAYFLLALPSAFVATALAFAMAALARSPGAAWGGAVILFLAFTISGILSEALGDWALAARVDPFGFAALLEIRARWTVLQKSTESVGLRGGLLDNRLLWLAVAGGAIAFTWARFRFAHHAPPRRWWHPAVRPAAARATPVAPTPVVPSAAEMAPTRPSSLEQLVAITGQSLRAILTSPGALLIPAAAIALVIAGPEMLEGQLGTPAEAVTARVLRAYAWPFFGIVAAVLITLFTGLLVWRERDARLGEIADATPVPEWVSLVGRFLAIVAMIVVLQAAIMAAGVQLQIGLGHEDLELGLHARMLFGVQLSDYLLFAVLALFLHVVVNQKHLATMLALLAWFYPTYAGSLGIEHKLLVYGSDPGLAWSEMSGWGGRGPAWTWFTLYWAGWALLLGLAAFLFWPRGREPGASHRFRAARQRLTRGPRAYGAAAAGVTLLLGGFVFWNTNVAAAWEPGSAGAERRVEYERRFGRFAGRPQPIVRATKLHVELDPAGGKALVGATYLLENMSGVAIDTVALTTNPGVETGAVDFGRPALFAEGDDRLGFRAYALASPLMPGESLPLTFDVRVARTPFPSGGAGAGDAILPNGTRFEHDGDGNPSGRNWLPLVGYRREREVGAPAARRRYDLVPRAELPSVMDSAVANERRGREQIAFEAVVGTALDQMAVAPGALRRTWVENGRRWYHYVTDAPITNGYGIFSARYAVEKGRWRDVEIEVAHDPAHGEEVARMVKSARAALEYYPRAFGAYYPHRQLRFVEIPGTSASLRAYPGTIMYTEEFGLLRPEADRRRIDLPFAIAAHEVAHQWWGHAARPALVEGAPLLTESLAWYSGMLAVEQEYGAAHLRRLLDLFRSQYLRPNPGRSVPLVRATDWLDVYRTGAFAMYALREYVGEPAVNGALRAYAGRFDASHPPYPRSLDLVAELRAATPDSLQPLIGDLFERITRWDMRTMAAGAVPADSGTWRVTLDVRARKVYTDTAGVETTAPMDDIVEIGIFGAGSDDGLDLGEPLYLKRHRIRAGDQRIIIDVRRRPAVAGIDPRNLLLDAMTYDNRKEVTIAP